MDGGSNNKEELGEVRLFDKIAYKDRQTLSSQKDVAVGSLAVAFDHNLGVPTQLLR